jgi:hypothetical protein
VTKAVDLIERSGGVHLAGRAVFDEVAGYASRHRHSGEAECDLNVTNDRAVSVDEPTRSLLPIVARTTKA